MFDPTASITSYSIYTLNIIYLPPLPPPSNPRPETCRSTGCGFPSGLLETLAPCTWTCSPSTSRPKMLSCSQPRSSRGERTSSPVHHKRNVAIMFKCRSAAVLQEVILEFSFPHRCHAFWWCLPTRKCLPCERMLHSPWGIVRC